jgi:hypothetical protein
MDDPLPTSFSTQEAAVDNTPDNRGRSSSRKRQLSSTAFAPRKFTLVQKIPRGEKLRHVVVAIPPLIVIDP